uniref:Ovule protein n=1 Tax=Panagrolaimus sp. JU765 TaxID=591449 RepID=A0AC34QC52_9BILA
MESIHSMCLILINCFNLSKIRLSPRLGLLHVFRCVLIADKMSQLSSYVLAFVQEKKRIMVTTRYSHHFSVF